MAKNLETYALGVKIDAKAAEAMASLKGIDLAAGKVSTDFARLEKQSATSARGIGSHWKGVFGKSTFTQLNLSGKQSFTQLEKDAQRTGEKIKKSLAAKLNLSGGGGGGGIGSLIGGGAAFGAGGLLVGAVAGGIGAIGGVLKDAAEQGLDFNATVESASISLERLLGNAEKATKHIGELKQAATLAPTGFESLLALDQLLQNVGFAAEGLPRHLADVAVGIGQLAGTKGLDERMELILRQIAQMATIGKTQNEELKVISENYIPVYDILSKKLAKTKAEIFDLAKDGKLRGKETGEIILQSLAETGQKAGEQVRNSYAVLKSNLEDAQQQLYGKGTQKLFEGVKDGMGLLLSYQDVADKLAAKLDFATGAAIEFGKGAVTALAKGDFLAAGGAMVGGVVEGVKNAAGEAYKAGESIVTSTYQGVKNAAGINSPAETFKPLGRYIDLGVATGITENGSIVNQAIGQVVQDALQHGLTKAQVKIQFERAKENLEDFKKAEASSGFDLATLLGIASRETNIKNIIGDRGRGVGMMQVDIGTDAAFKAAGKWKDAGVAIERGAQILQQKMQQLISLAGKEVTIKDRKGRAYTFTVPKLEGEQLRQTAIAAYNSGLWAAYHVSKGRSPDYGTTGKDYSADVMARADQFRALLGGQITPPKTSGFALSLVERQALYNPGAQPSAPAKVLPFSAPSRTQIFGTSQPSPSPAAQAQIVDLAAYKAEVKDNTAAIEKLAEVNTNLIKVDTSKLEASRTELTSAKASLFGAERAASTSLFEQTNYGVAGTVKENQKKAIRGSVSLFGSSSPNAPIEQEGVQIQNASQGAAAGLKAAGKEAKGLASGAFGQLASGVGGMVQDFVMLGETGPGALKKITAQVLASLAAEATIKALYYTAEGFAWLFVNPAKASGYFTAAGIMAGVAGASAIAGRALAGSANKGGQFSQQQNRDVTSEGYSGNRFSRDTYASGNGNPKAVEFLLQQINNKLQPVNGDTLVVGAIKRNPQAVGSAAVQSINQNDQLSRRLGQRIAA
jgi:tape measure domain-containing protein